MRDSKNKRESFRINLNNWRCTAISERHKHKVKINDLSTGGMSFTCPFDAYEKHVQLKFEIGEEEFERFSKILRKTENEDGSITYAVKFIDYTERERARLNSKIVQLDSRRRMGTEE